MTVLNPLAVLEEMNDLEKKIFKHFMTRTIPVLQHELTEELGVSQSTVSRQLAKMIDRGIVQKIGQTRGAKFTLNEKLRYWATPSHRRPTVLFSRQRFDDYEPNITRWLPEKVRAKMASVAPGDKVLDASTYSRGIAERFLIDLTWASSSLEGNTYSMLETESLVKYGEVADNKSVHEATMILNHKRAIGLMLEQVVNNDLYPEMLQKIHTFMMRGLLELRVLGKIRHSGVRISNSSYIPSDNNQELSSSLSEILYKATKIKDPYEAMFFITAGLSYLQPFEDGNKRMGRLMGNLPLLRAGLPPMSFVGVNKMNYIQGLIEFYELGDTATLAQALGDAYVEAAHVYHASTTALRTPKGIELRMNKEISAIMKEAIEKNLTNEDDWIALVSAKTPNLDIPERNAVVEIVTQYIQELDSTNAVLWDVDDVTVLNFLNNRENLNVSPKKIKP